MTLLLSCCIGGCASHSGRQRLATTQPAPPPPAPAAAYLGMLRGGIAHSRGRMLVMTASAESAADRVVAGAKLYVTSPSQPDFTNELVERAGGLMGIISGVPRQLDRGDVILYAVRSRIETEDQGRISAWRAQGAYVVVFASASLSNNPYFPPDALIDSGDSEGLPLADGKIAAVDTVLNVTNAWAWTGEFIAACTRRGRMPIVYQSYHLPGGLARAAHYGKRMFHDDLTIGSVGPGEMGQAYLDRIDRAIAAMEHESLDGFARAGGWVRETDTPQRSLQIMAHLFPEHAADPRTPQLFARTSGLVMPESQSRFVLALGYQHPAQLLIDAARLHRFKLLYTSVERGADDRSDDIVYVDPHWPMDDACVNVVGYDVPALPASGVVQAAVYWSVVSEAIGVRPAPENGKWQK